MHRRLNFDSSDYNKPGLVEKKEEREGERIGKRKEEGQVGVQLRLLLIKGS